MLDVGDDKSGMVCEYMRRAAVTAEQRMNVNSVFVDGDEVPRGGRSVQ